MLLFTAKQLQNVAAELDKRVDAISAELEENDGDEELRCDTLHPLLFMIGLIKTGHFDSLTVTDDELFELLEQD